MLTRISEAQTQYDEAWAVIMNYRGEEKAEVLANISTARETYKGMLGDVITEYQSNPADNDSANMMSTAITFYLQNLDPALSSFKEPEVQAFLAKSKAEASKASRYLQQSRIIAIVGTGITLFGVAMTFIYAFGMTRIVRSILEIIDTANSISRGDLDIPIDTEKPGEIGELAEAIERMRTSLKAAIERLRR